MSRSRKSKSYVWNGCHSKEIKERQLKAMHDFELDPELGEK